MRAIPEIEMLTNYMAGLIQLEGDNYDIFNAVKLKKRLVRYCLLSWTMCLTSISQPFENKMNTSQDYIKKGLINQAELEALKVIQITIQPIVDYY